MRSSLALAELQYGLRLLRYFYMVLSVGKTFFGFRERFLIKTNGKRT